MRSAAASSFGQLDKSVQDQHVEALAALLQHEDLGVRRTAASAFGKLDQSVMGQHVQSVVALVQHEDPDIRSTSTSAFGLDAASQFAMGSGKSSKKPVRKAKSLKQGLTSPACNNCQPKTTIPASTIAFAFDSSDSATFSFDEQSDNNTTKAPHAKRSCQASRGQTAR